MQPRIDEKINKLMANPADADEVLFNYIQDRVSKLHEQKSALKRKLRTKIRKRDYRHEFLEKATEKPGQSDGTGKA